LVRLPMQHRIQDGLSIIPTLPLLNGLPEPQSAVLETASTGRTGYGAVAFQNQL
jgi:hypothetical protein